MGSGVIAIVVAGVLTFAPPPSSTTTPVSKPPPGNDPSSARTLPPEEGTAPPSKKPAGAPPSATEPSPDTPNASPDTPATGSKPSPDAPNGRSPDAPATGSGPSPDAPNGRSPDAPATGSGPSPDAPNASPESSPETASGPSPEPASEEDPPAEALQVRAQDVATPSQGGAADLASTPFELPSPGSTFERRHDPHRTFFLAGGVTAAAIGVALSSVSIYGITRYNRLSNRLFPVDLGGSPRDTEEEQRIRDQRRTWETTAIVTGVVGLAFLVTGLTLTGLGIVRTPVQVQPAAGPNHASLQLTGRF